MNLHFSVIWCLGILVVVIWTNRKLEQKDRLPNLATMLGVLGTFVGICVGLFGLNISPSAPNMNLLGSVQSLLAGLRFAFITSVFGMSIAVFLKVFHAKAYEKQQDAIKLLESIDGLLKADRESDSDSETLAEIAQTLKEGVATLISETRSLRSDLNAFEADIAESCAKALERAMEQAMQNFNAEISRQCGESFRRLAEATDRMLEWQQEYQQQMDAQLHQIDRSIKALDACEQTLTTIVEKSDRFSTIAERLDQSLEELNSLDASIEARTQQIIEAVNLAADLLEPAQKAILQGTENLNNSSPLMLEAVHAFSEAADQISESMQDQRNLIRSSQNEVNSAIQAAAEQVGNSIGALITERSEALSSLHQNMERVLTASLRTLAGQLTQISEKFVQDYGPLVEKMRAIMEIARDLEE